MNYKLAIFITGPYRYLPYVIENVKERCRDVGFDIFVHVWSEDLGNNVHPNGGSIQLESFFDDSVKSFIVEKGIQQDALGDRYGHHMGAPSPLNAMVGMFYAITTLFNQVKLQSGYEDYTHILRVRTDCCLFKDICYEDLNNTHNSIYVANNEELPSEWVSDHIMLSSVELFEKIWVSESIVDFISKFDLSERNPERFVSENIFKYEISHEYFWYRNQDYVIITANERKSNPDWLNELISKGHSLKVFDLDGKYHKIKQSKIDINRKKNHSKVKRILLNFMFYSKSYFNLVKKIIRE